MRESRSLKVYGHVEVELVEVHQEMAYGVVESMKSQTSFENGAMVGKGGAAIGD